MTTLITAAKPNRTPGSRGNDILVKREVEGKWKTVGAIRNPSDVHGMTYGEPAFRDEEAEQWFRDVCEANQPVTLMLRYAPVDDFSNATEVVGEFRIVSCEHNEIAIKQSLALAAE